MSKPVKKKSARAKAKAARAREDKRTARMVRDRRARPKTVVPAPKKKLDEPVEKAPKPTLFEMIAESPVKWDKPDKLSVEFLEELDVCFDGMTWVKEYCPRGFPMDEKKISELMRTKPGASITFEDGWPAWVMNTMAVRAMQTVDATHPDYTAVRQHCALVLRSFLKEYQKRRSIGHKHVEAGIGSEGDMNIDLCKILVRHYDKL